MQLVNTTVAALLLAGCAGTDSAREASSTTQNGADAAGAEHYGSSAPGTYGSDTGPYTYHDATARLAPADDAAWTSP